MYPAGLALTPSSMGKPAGAHFSTNSNRFCQWNGNCFSQVSSGFPQARMLLCV